MWKPLLAVLALVTQGCASTPAAFLPDGIAKSNPTAPNLKFTNGRWYSDKNGQITFEQGHKYSVNGVFTAIEPDSYKTIDLEGQFVIPPFGEAHNHSVDGKGTEKTAQKYLDEGVFYYKNTNSIYSITKPLLNYWAQSDTLDVSFSFGGLSMDEGHPEKLYRTLSSYGLYSDIDVEAMEGNAFYDVDTMAELDAKWDGILALEPDFLKLYLLEHDTDDNAGLPEDIFREIVRRAQMTGLRTTVHVETVQDLALAVDAGADEAAHLPAYNLSVAKDSGSSIIPDELISKMAQRGFVTVATVNVSANREYSEEDYKIVSDRQADNLKRMHAAGAPIAIGSDTFFATAQNEIETLRTIGPINDTDLLRLWINTPKVSIFPDRAIGVLSSGYESSFLVLSCDPVQQFECVQNISMAYKQGVKLEK